MIVLLNNPCIFAHAFLFRLPLLLLLLLLSFTGVCFPVASEGL